MPVNLSPRGDLVEVAASLFALLHELDNPACAGQRQRGGEKAGLKHRHGGGCGMAGRIGTD